MSPRLRYFSMRAMTTPQARNISTSASSRTRENKTYTPYIQGRMGSLCSQKRVRVLKVFFTKGSVTKDLGFSLTFFPQTFVQQKDIWPPPFLQEREEKGILACMQRHCACKHCFCRWACKAVNFAYKWADLSRVSFEAIFHLLASCYLSKPGSNVLFTLYMHHVY